MPRHSTYDVIRVCEKCGKDFPFYAHPCNIRLGRGRFCSKKCHGAYTRIHPYRHFEDLTRQPFGKLTVLNFAGRKGRAIQWRCLCECGQETIVSTNKLKKSITRSCGCLRGVNLVKHGFARVGRIAPEYTALRQAIDRCDNKHNKSYSCYGGRGITVCERWRNSFEAFLADMGPRPSKQHSLDRFPDQNGNYEPGNCRWATKKEQANNMRSNHLLTANGRTHTLADWSRETGIGFSTILHRIYRGWTVEDAIFTPVKK